ncbi:MAG: pirin family protein, partial [Bacteroidota bacterium]|nr:pirin family protein [Bacteroidota bacterium]
KLFATLLDSGKSLSYDVAPGRALWVQAVSGKLSVNGIEIGTGDAAAITDETKLVIDAKENSHILLFDLN